MLRSMEATIIIVTVLSIFPLYLGSLLGMRFIVLAIILVRPSCDLVFDVTKSVLGETSVGPGAVANALIVGLAFLYFLQTPVLLGSATLSMWAGFLITALASIMVSPEPGTAARGVFWLTTYVAVFALPFALIRSKESALRCLTVALYSSFLPVAYGFVELVFGNTETEDGLRLQSTFSHPNIFAFYLVGVFALTLFLLNSNRVSLSSRVQGFLIAYQPVLIFLIVLTKSRSAWAGTGVLLSVMIGLVNRRYLWLLLLAPLILLIPGIAERFFDVGTEIPSYRYARLNSYAWRELLWRDTLEWMSANPAPLLGHGLNSFVEFVTLFFPAARESGGAGIGPHNALLQIYFELGLLGLITFAWLFVSLFLKLKDGYWSDKRGSMIIMALVLAHLVESYSDNMFDYLSYQWFFWFLMGTMCAWNRCYSASYEVPKAGLFKQNLLAKGSA